MQHHENNLAQVAKRVFATKDGEALLNALRQRTVERSSFPASATDGHAMALMMALREGENNICRWLEVLNKPQENQE